jgi:hypothetical protein
MTDGKHSRLAFPVEQLQPNTVCECDRVAPLTFPADHRQHAPLIVGYRKFVRLGYFGRQLQRMTPAYLSRDDPQEQMLVALATLQHDEISVSHDIDHFSPSVSCLMNQS